jgi:hypothetical protein
MEKGKFENMRGSQGKGSITNEASSPDMCWCCSILPTVYNLFFSKNVFNIMLGRLYDCYEISTMIN